MREKLVFLVGAGASAPRPSNLPLFAHLRAKILALLKLKGHNVELAEQLAPEAFMRAVYEGGLPVEQWLTSNLGRGDPNANHYAIAAGLKLGAKSWILNADELVESVCQRLSIPHEVSAYDERIPKAGATILKPHGTVGRGRYVFRSDQVARPLSEPWADRLRADLLDAHVVAIGYRGLDVDMRTVLNDGLATASSITWFERESEIEELKGRLPVLAGGSATLVGSETFTGITRNFLDWADAEGLTESMPPEVRASSVEETNPHAEALQGSAVMARAYVYERLGERRRARRNFMRSMMLPPFSMSRLKRTARRTSTISLYEPTLLARIFLRVSASPKLRRLLKRKLRARLDRVHVTLLGSHFGFHEAAMDRAKIAEDPSDAAILLAEAKAARFLGDLQTTISAAGDALGLAEHGVEDMRSKSRAGNQIDDTVSGLVDEGAHALFEIGFAYAWLGEFEKSQGALARLRRGYDALAGVRWIAWGQWQEACLLLYKNNAADALKLLDEARATFKADGLKQGEVASLIVKLTACRMLDWPIFTECLAELNDNRDKPGWSRGWTEYTDHGIELEHAEWLRAHGNLDDAGQLLAGVIAASRKRPVRLAVALLAKAELARQRGLTSPRELEQAEVLAEAHGIKYVQAHGIIARYLAGELSANEGLRRIQATGVSLATRDHLPPRDPSDFCLGRDPTVHELFFP